MLIEPQTHQGGTRAEQRPGVSYSAVRTSSLLRQEPDGRGGWRWAIHPYDGCELACTFCPLRMDRKDFGSWYAFQSRIAVKTNAVEALVRELRNDELRGAPLSLGTGADPWQPAEEQFRLTRAILTALRPVEALDLAVHTRSSLIARDVDLLKELSVNGHLTVAVSVVALDEKISRLLEPKAPSVFRRLAAIEALARAGLTVGLRLAPVMLGLDDEEVGMESLLTRASNAGARFAQLEPMQFGVGQRESFLTHATTAYPDKAARFRRVIGRRPPTPEERAERLERFEGLCAKLGLAPREVSPPARPARRLGPAQLPLFDGLGA